MKFFNSSEFLKLFKAKLMEKYSTNELTMKHHGFLDPNLLFICNKKYLIFSIIDGLTYSIKFEWLVMKLLIACFRYLIQCNLFSNERKIFAQPSHTRLRFLLFKQNPKKMFIFSICIFCISLHFFFYRLQIVFDWILKSS